jgi:hypothetical protein
MAKTIDNEVCMPRKGCPAPRQEAYFDKGNVEESLVESDEMSVSRLGSAQAQAQDHQDFLAGKDEIDGWAITIQEVASITSEDQAKQKQKINSQKNACKDNFIGMTILDESLSQESDWSTVLLALKNYWRRWNNTGTAIWTDSRAGNYQYMGWADAAYVQFDGIYKRIREQCQSASNMKLEQAYLARSCSRLAGGGPHSRRLMGGQVETNVMEVYNKLDSEDED